MYKRLRPSINGERPVQQVSEIKTGREKEPPQKVVFHDPLGQLFLFYEND
ncbi:hypothetical protein SD77_2083 [Bacillus badius]|uniref:Mobile element protein n=1 Tax=Bacillus badius TaxID=1455 RepID=A0ABR5AY71_BACBA|nr:hypothetical protein SD77_2083 [Bacillus badius]